MLGNWHQRRTNPLRVNGERVWKARGTHHTIFPRNLTMSTTSNFGDAGIPSVGRDVGIGKSGSRAAQVVNLRNPCHRIGTWNVRTMRKPGKLENIKREMDRYKVEVLGLAETRWRTEGEFKSGRYTIIHTTCFNGQGGVGLIIGEHFIQALLEVKTFGSRLILARFAAKPVDIVIIQCYMPTSTSTEAVMEEIYEILENILEDLHGDDNVIIMGDWNAVVGEGRDEGIVGGYGLGDRNDRGQRLVDFCKQEGYVITNTWYPAHVRRRYTWKSPGDRRRFQIDYILVKRRYRNQVKKSMSYPGADADSDHSMVILNSRLELRKPRKPQGHKKWNVDKLKNLQIRHDYQGRCSQLIPEQRRGGEVAPEVSQDRIEQRWENIKQAITSAATEVLGSPMKVVRKPWITHQILGWMDEKRVYKNSTSESGQARFRQLRNKIQRECKRAREIWWETQCQEVETLERQGRIDLAYKRIKATSCTKNQIKVRTLKDENNKDITGLAEKGEVWHKYVETLYSNGISPQTKDLHVASEDDPLYNHQILREEFDAAIDALPAHKAAGVDLIPAELIKHSGEKTLTALYELVCTIYETGKWPSEHCKTVIIPIPKTASARSCGDFRTISLTSHASKILLYIIRNRIDSHIEQFLDDSQFGFRKKSSTRDATACLRVLGERFRNMDRTLFVAYIDFEKAFDRVSWDKLFPLMKKIGIPEKLCRLIRELYDRQEAIVRFDGGESKPAKILRGVRQGCLLSPGLFNVFAELILSEAFDDTNYGVRIGGRTVRTIKFADDLALIAGTASMLNRMLDKLNRKVVKYGMKINILKTKTMALGANSSSFVATIGTQQLEQVQSFRYLGTLITQDLYCSQDIRSRIALAKQAFRDKQQTFTCQKISKALRKRLIKIYVWSIALYGAETWTISRRDAARIQALEMWCWRRMENISWRERVSNEEVLERVGERRNIMQEIRRRKLRWIGHSLRNGGLLRDIMEGRIEGKRPRGRPRNTWMGSLFQDAECSNYEQMKNLSRDRLKWRELVMRAD